MVYGENSAIVLIIEKGNNLMDALFAGSGLLFIISLLLAVLWICLPFAIFGFQKKMNEQLTLHKKTNKLLSALIIHQSAISGVEVKPEEEDDPNNRYDHEIF